MVSVLNGDNDHGSTMWSDGISYKPLAAVPRLVMRVTMSPIMPQKKIFLFKKTSDQRIHY